MCAYMNLAQGSKISATGRTQPVMRRRGSEEGQLPIPWGMTYSRGYVCGHWSHPAWLQSPALQLTSFLTLVMSLGHLMFQFPYLYNGDNSNDDDSYSWRFLKDHMNYTCKAVAMWVLGIFLEDWIGPPVSIWWWWLKKSVIEGKPCERC